MSIREGVSGPHWHHAGDPSCIDYKYIRNFGLVDFILLHTVVNQLSWMANKQGTEVNGSPWYCLLVLVSERLQPLNVDAPFSHNGWQPWILKPLMIMVIFASVAVIFICCCYFILEMLLLTLIKVLLPVFWTDWLGFTYFLFQILK